jgi:hypothetical protein
MPTKIWITMKMLITVNLNEDAAPVDYDPEAAAQDFVENLDVPLSDLIRKEVLAIVDTVQLEPWESETL